MDAVITLVLFLGLGYLLDRWLGTEPWFMIGLFLLSAVGVFIGWKARYTARMEALEEQRRLDSTRHRQAAPDVSTMDAETAS